MCLTNCYLTEDVIVEETKRRLLDLPSMIPKYHAGWWVKGCNGHESSIWHNRGIIKEYCGYYLPGEFRKTGYHGANLHGCTGHVYWVERHRENWQQEFRDYYVSEEYIEPDI